MCVNDFKILKKNEKSGVENVFESVNDCNLQGERAENATCNENK